MTCAMPTPSNIVTSTMCNVELFVSNVVISTSVSATTVMPAATTALLPKRCAQRGAIGASTIIITAWGMSTAPAFMAE